MGFPDRLRRRGDIAVDIYVRKLPEHMWYSAYLCLTKVPRVDSPFPTDDPGAPFHKCDEAIQIAEGFGRLVQPLIAKTTQPNGFYFVMLRVMLGRMIKDEKAAQIENFNLSGEAAEVAPGVPLRFEGTVTWPQVGDADLHDYGSVKPSSPKRA